MIRNISKFLIRFGDINPEEHEIIEYGLTQGINSLAGIIIALFLGCIMGVGAYSCIFLISFIPLRIYAGGYHADTRIRCGILSFIFMVLICIAFTNWVLNDITTLMSVLVGGAAIYCLAPIDNKNRCYDKLEKILFRKKYRKILYLEVIISIVSWITKINFIFIGISAAVSMELLLLILGKVKKAMSNTDNKKL